MDSTIKTKKIPLPTLCCTCKGWKFLKRKPLEGIGVCLSKNSIKKKRVTDYCEVCDSYICYRKQ